MKPQFPAFSALRAESFGGIFESIRSICAQLNDCFGLAQRYLARTSERDIIRDVVSPATADQPFRVSHSLGVTPTFVSAIMEAAGSVYATREDRTEWTATSVKIRCPVANCSMIVKVEA